MQQITFTRDLDRAQATKMFFINEEAKAAVLNFLKRAVKVL